VSRAHFAFVLALVGCGGSFQSARTLAACKTQVTADVSAFHGSGLSDVRPPETRGWNVLGDLMVRHGIIDGLDAGVRIGRTPGSQTYGDTGSQLFVDLKKRLTAAASTTTISIDVPVGVLWSERRETFNDGTLALVPTLLVGHDINATTELIIAPKFLWLHRAANNDGYPIDSTIGGGVSLGIRFSDDRRAWAIQPELSVLKLEGTDGALITFGLGVAAGN
jgi:hypothetical protein